MPVALRLSTFNQCTAQSGARHFRMNSYVGENGKIFLENKDYAANDLLVRFGDPNEIVLNVFGYAAGNRRQVSDA